MPHDYRWHCPHEWFRDKVLDYDHEMLLATLIALSMEMDDDQMQDMFGEEMEMDGYFEEVKRCS